MRVLAGVVVAALLAGGGIAIGRWVVPAPSSAAAQQGGTTTTTSLAVEPTTTTSTTAAATGTPDAGTSLPIGVQAVDDGVSPPASILAPVSCRLSGSLVTAQGSYTGAVSEGYLRVGDVVELYVYSSPVAGLPQGVQLGALSSERPAQVGLGPTGASTTGPGAVSWTTTVPIETAAGTPARCAVTVQATHQFEGAPNAY
ncbi:MAG TPA: hypothetical protein VE991_06785 [Acidimicrobiales bacterium]|nr:hypothetical protein [Acidimicrobiales bacterium]